MKKTAIIRFISAAVIFLCLLGAGRTAVKADAASPVTIGDIDYERLTMKIYKNGNTNIYYSQTMNNDLGAWDEVSGITAADTDGKGTYVLMDISWTSSASDFKFYLRGDQDMTALEVTLPKLTSGFKVTFDKVNSDFTFSGQDDRKYFFYRKSTDYNWIKVYFEDSGVTPPADSTTEISYDDFLVNVEALRFKGAKLVMKLGQEVGTGADSMGSRPSKEISVSVSKYASAPAVKLNVTKLTFNTKATMEYTTDLSSGWTTCEKNMKLDDLAPAALLAEGKSTGSEDVILYFRLQATEKKPCSQIMTLLVPAQKAAPSIGENGTDVKCSYANNKLQLQFATASKTNAVEYCVIPEDGDFDAFTAKWKTIKANKTVSLSAKAAKGATIYVRFKGIAENTNKKIDLVLPSTYASYDANGFQ